MKIKIFIQEFRDGTIKYCQKCNYETKNEIEVNTYTSLRKRNIFLSFKQTLYIHIIMR